jgi:phasin family protein
MFGDKKAPTDLASVMDQFSSLMQGFKVPGVNMDEILSAQRKNMEACTRAAKIASEAANAVGRRQVELMSQALTEATSLMQGYNPSARPEEVLARHAELAKKAFETSLTNARELAEMVGKSTEEAFQIVQRRVTEGLDEIHRAAQQPKK